MFCSSTYFEFWQVYHEDVFHSHIAVVLIFFILNAAHGSVSIIPAIFSSSCFFN